MPVIDIFDWDPAERIAYATGTPKERAALIVKHHGPLPEPDEPREIVAIVIQGAIAPPVIEGDDEQYQA
jgi:hypothetical protein